MTRATRLLDLLQLLRRHRYPVAGAELARELDISLRTLYRDIAALQAQGAHIEGEPGVGYVLRPGYMLPPLMLSQEELEALVLGTRWVADRADARLGEAAHNALTKIAAVLPKDMSDDLESTGLLIAPTWPRHESTIDLGDVRSAIRAEQCVSLSYTDLKGDTTERTVWPFALGFFDHVRLLIGWCELRQDFRSFRTDRIKSWDLTGKRYPKRRAALLKAWKTKKDAEACEWQTQNPNLYPANPIRVGPQATA
ncbi:HTH domain protein [Asticcacaulis biprosthecium C19]|uniref:HTH domain protein n=1 Tax=Asticcacaulis biprosthecium C19 TaxID=715226 RepID=F4QRW8_9CAUL|nr:YafY family protein [Asticcacaulis biprosthecium]EGF89488.1 HTH domain protein [Asticcacaulis biprosthecium C19]